MYHFPLQKENQLQAFIISYNNCIMKSILLAIGSLMMKHVFYTEYSLAYRSILLSTYIYVDNNNYCPYIAAPGG